jgi:6-phospho-beta-glucosidase
MEAIENDNNSIQVVNTRNLGTVPFLKQNDVTEIRCLITRNGPVPLPLRQPVSEHIKGLMQSVKVYERLAARAALTGCYSDALAALISNPLTHSYNCAKVVLDEMLEANRANLPQFFKGEEET